MLMKVALCLLLACAFTYVEGAASEGGAMEEDKRISSLPKWMLASNARDTRGGPIIPKWRFQKRMPILPSWLKNQQEKRFSDWMQDEVLTKRVLPDWMYDKDSVIYKRDTSKQEAKDVTRRKVDHSLKNGNVNDLCYVMGESCKEEYSSKFKCKCPSTRAFCVGSGKYYSAECVPEAWISTSGGYVWVQPGGPTPK